MRTRALRGAFRYVLWRRTSKLGVRTERKKVSPSSRMRAIFCHGAKSIIGVQRSDSHRHRRRFPLIEHDLFAKDDARDDALMTHHRGDEVGCAGWPANNVHSLVDLHPPPFFGVHSLELEEHFAGNHEETMKFPSNTLWILPNPSGPQ